MSPQLNIFDGSALVSLFHGDRRATDLLVAADAGQDIVVLPALAIAEANVCLHASANEWEAILLGRLVCTDLTANIAIEIGIMSDDLGAAVAAHEAQSVGGWVVTAEPDRYAAWETPLLVL